MKSFDLKTLNETMKIKSNIMFKAKFMSQPRKQLLTLLR